MSETETVRVGIEGRVQGVWYRAWTVERAAALGLRGWVRNRRDGSVEALLSGPPAAVAEMLRAFWQGPPAASVTTVTSRPAPGDEVPGGFTQRSTA